MNRQKRKEAAGRGSLYSRTCHEHGNCSTVHNCGTGLPLFPKEHRPRPPQAPQPPRSGSFFVINHGLLVSAAASRMRILLTVAIRPREQGAAQKAARTRPSAARSSRPYSPCARITRRPPSATPPLIGAPQLPNHGAAHGTRRIGVLQRLPDLVRGLHRVSVDIEDKVARSNAEVGAESVRLDGEHNHPDLPGIVAARRSVGGSEHEPEIDSAIGRGRPLDGRRPGGRRRSLSEDDGDHRFGAAVDNAKLDRASGRERSGRQRHATLDTRPTHRAKAMRSPWRWRRPRCWRSYQLRQ
jgi:hypothetical protein